ncbi:MAG: hypothetical protein J0I12_25355 [Candidatus Eremiobacteraeota bacterium]|nr:hypothetical protein [Candidatus Eremiobacteraeota bacterium]
MDAGHFSALAGSFGDSLPGGFCAAPEGTQGAGHFTATAGLEKGPLSGDGKGGFDVSVSSNKALTTADGNFVDTELRKTLGGGTAAELKLGTVSNDSKTMGIGDSWQATLPQSKLGDCVDASNPASWASGTDLARIRDQYAISDTSKSLGVWSAQSVTEKRQGEIEGVTKDGDSVMAYNGEITSEHQKHQFGMEGGVGGSLELSKDAELAGHLDGGVSVGRNDSVEQVKGKFTEMGPNGLQSGTLLKTTYENAVGLNADFSAGFQAKIGDWTFGGDAKFGGLAVGNSTFREQTIKDYDNSPAQVKTDVYAETWGQRGWERVEKTDASGSVSKSQSVTMATDPAYKEMWSDVFGPKTRFDGNNVVLDLTDEKAGELSKLVQDDPIRRESGFGDALSKVKTAEELAWALTEASNTGNNFIIEDLSRWSRS